MLGQSPEDRVERVIEIVRVIRHVESRWKYSVLIITADVPTCPQSRSQSSPGDLCSGNSVILSTALLLMLTSPAHPTALTSLAEAWPGTLAHYLVGQLDRR